MSENPETIEIDGLPIIHKLCHFASEHGLEGCTWTEIVEHLFPELEYAKKREIQTIPKDFVLLENKPYAYVIRHKLWSGDACTEIHLATEFGGDYGIQKERLSICIPLYKGIDEATI